MGANINLYNITIHTQIQFEDDIHEHIHRNKISMMNSIEQGIIERKLLIHLMIMLLSTNLLLPLSRKIGLP